MNVKDLITRAGAGVIYILVILLGVLGGRFSFLAVFGAILGVALFEFYRMVEKDTSHAISKIFNITLGGLIFFSVFLYLENINSYALLVMILVYMLILIASAIFIQRKDILHGIIYSVFGQIYITMPLSILMLISYSYQNNLAGEGYDWVPILALFVFIWVNDTAAYFFGTLIGKHKLIEHISPKKSVEGFIAGIIFTLLASLIFGRLFPEFSTLFWMGFAVVVALFGTLGDLFESLIKRTCIVKDTGHLIPGHGGILDRIDSLLVAVPAAYLFLILFLSL
ncbi:MAG: phosphatidate cytidylyltransferase [Bacteroidales bacterium]|nr:phosphatidate cytidylyltransferase [Bacteroidales bacterium]